MKEKLFLLLIFASILFSCTKYSKPAYPQSVSANIPYTHIMRHHELEVDSITAIPENIQHKITQHLKSRLGNEKFNQLNYESIYIWSNKPIHIDKSKSLVQTILYGNDSITKATGTGIDSIYNYPLYSTFFKLKIPEVGIEELSIQLVVDMDAEIIKDIEYPENGFNDFIPIDSVHSELIRRKISSNKLNIHLTYDNENQKFIWSTNTLISQGSILGGGCIPEVEHHFKMDAFNGNVTEYSFDNHSEYILDLY